LPQQTFEQARYLENRTIALHLVCIYVTCTISSGGSRKLLLAMKVDCAINGGSASGGTIIRTCENGCIHSVYYALDRLFRPARGGYRLLFQRVGGE
jgi:hypothetical protein